MSSGPSSGDSNRDNVQPVKTSTPTKEEVCAMDVSNISHISNVTFNEGRPRQNQNNVPISKSRKKKENNLVKCDENFEYDAGFNNLLLSAMIEKCASNSFKETKDNIEENFALLRQKIEKNNELIQENKVRIKKIETYKKVSSLLMQKKSEFITLSDQFESLNDSIHQDKSEVLVKELKKKRNTLIIKNVTTSNSAASIGEALTEVIGEQGKQQILEPSPNDVICELVGSLEEFQNKHEEMNHNQECWSEKLPSLKSMALEHICNEIGNTNKENICDGNASDQ